MGCQIFLTDVLQCVSQKNPTIICSNVRNVVQNVKKWFVAEKKSMPWSFTISNANPLVTSRTLLLLFVGYD